MICFGYMLKKVSHYSIRTPNLANAFTLIEPVRPESHLLLRFQWLSSIRLFFQFFRHEKIG